MSEIGPPIGMTSFNQTLNGFYGSLGSSANISVSFLQSVMRPTELEKTTLISEIKGSERWPVRNLFQREIDSKRVEKGLMKYLSDPNKVRFFNPLTLTLLPMVGDGTEVETQIPFAEKMTIEDDEREYEILEFPGLFRFKHIVGYPEWGSVQWNDAKVRVVAIDGQHRLSALKRLFLDPDVKNTNPDFLQWSIPVVILAFHVLDKGKDTRSVLEVVRNIFIYINKEAKKPNRSREILLSDESINALAVQELLQRSHENDLLPKEERDNRKMPLFFFDWRGEEEDQKRISPVAAVKDVEEIYGWLENFILGADFGKDQEVALGIQPTDPLKPVFLEKRVGASGTVKVRQKLKNTVIGGIAYVLENFAPLRKYIEELRGLEKKYDISDAGRHALHELRFGKTSAPEYLKKDVRQISEELEKRLTLLKLEHIKYPLSLDIGARAIMYGFGKLREFHLSVSDSLRDWIEFAKWFTIALNNVYADGWIGNPDRPKQEMLKHLLQDHNDTIVNYRFSHIGDSYGALLTLLIGDAGGLMEEYGEWGEFADKVLEDSIGTTLLRGYKKEVRPALKERFPHGGTELTKAVNAMADKKKTIHLAELKRELSFSE